MTDSHQAIYDAVRSKISGGNIADAVQTAIREANIGHYFMLAAEGMKAAAWQWGRPSVLFRPDVAIDGNKYSVLYGSNLMEGCAGFGDTLAEAMADFVYLPPETNNPAGVTELPLVIRNCHSPFHHQH